MVHYAHVLVELFKKQSDLERSMCGLYPIHLFAPNLH